MPWTARRSTSLRSPPEENHFNRLDEDPEIQTNRHVLDIEEVILQLLAGVFDRISICVTDLSPACNARTDDVTKVIVRNLLAEALYELGPFGPRPDKPHVSPQHVPHLGDFIEPEVAQYAAHSGNPRISIGGPGRPAVCFRIGSHSAKFVTGKDATPQSYASLAV